MTTEREYVVLTLEDHKPSRDGTMCSVCCVNNPPDTMSWWSEPWPCPTVRLAAAEQRAERAEQENRELVAALDGLKAHEWEHQATMSGERKLFCPACLNPKEWVSEFTRQRHAATDRPDGHRQGCWLAIALERAVLARAGRGDATDGEGA